MKKNSDYQVITSYSQLITKHLSFIDLFKPHVLSAIDIIREKKKCPDVDSIFNHIAKGSTTNIDRDVVESFLIELINQKIISNKKQVVAVTLFIVQRKALTIQTY